MKPKRPSPESRAASSEPLPALSDPNHVAEIYVNHTAGISFRDGVVHLTLSVVRPLHHCTVSGPDLENVVAARIALTPPALEALILAYGELAAALRDTTPAKTN